MIRVLFVDDDPQAQKTLSMVLADGYVVSSALTAAAGLERARTDRPDVVLLDIDLPDASGLDLLDAILGWPDPPPVIMLTETYSGCLRVFEECWLNVLDQILQYELLRSVFMCTDSLVCCWCNDRTILSILVDAGLPKTAIPPSLRCGILP